MSYFTQRGIRNTFQAPGSLHLLLEFVNNDSWWSCNCCCHSIDIKLWWRSWSQVPVLLVPLDCANVLWHRLYFKVSIESSIQLSESQITRALTGARPRESFVPGRKSSRLILKPFTHGYVASVSWYQIKLRCLCSVMLAPKRVWVPRPSLRLSGNPGYMRQIVTEEVILVHEQFVMCVCWFWSMFSSLECFNSSECLTTTNLWCG